MSLGAALAAASRVDKKLSGPEARRAIFSTVFDRTDRFPDARLSYPQLRRAALQQCRRDRPAVGMGAPQARSRAFAVRGPARSLRNHPDRHRYGIAGVPDARPTARGI